MVLEVLLSWIFIFVKFLFEFFDVDNFLGVVIGKLQDFFVELLLWYGFFGFFIDGYRQFIDYFQKGISQVVVVFWLFQFNLLNEVFGNGFLVFGVFDQFYVMFFVGLEFVNKNMVGYGQFFGVEIGNGIECESFCFFFFGKYYVFYILYQEDVYYLLIGQFFGIVDVDEVVIFGI